MVQCRSAAFLLALAAFALAKVQVYEPPSIYKRSEGFRLKAGGQKVTVLAHDKYDYAHFSADSGSDIEVTVRGKVPIKKISIVSSRFDYYNKPKLHKNTLSWRLQDHKYYILKIEGLRELVVAVDPLETAVPPNAGPNIFNVVSAKYKADKLGNRLTTHAFAAAIADAGQSPRDNPIVYVPAGVYLVGNLVLPSKVSLYLAPGAVLRFTGNPKDYTEHWMQDGEGRAGTNWISTAHNSTDVKIFGRGTIDGNAYAYKDAKFAPSIVVPVLTSRFTFDGPILRESGSTALNVVRSSAVNITNLKVFNRIEDMEDNGSVDLVESQNVTVSDAIGISVADTFTTKASKPPGPGVLTWPGTPMSSSNILFQNCLGWTANYGFKVGQGAMSDQKNIKFFGNTVYDAAVGMGIHKKWGPGSATNVTFENMIIKSTSYTTSHLSGMVGSWLALFVEDGKAGVGPISNVHVNNVMVLGDGGSTPLVSGLPGANVSNVEFRNIWLPQATHPAASLQDLGAEEMKFTTNVTVVNAWDSPEATAKAAPEAPTGSSQPDAQKQEEAASQTTLEME
ncbi:putative glycosyl hydrolases family 28 [Lyophyllum shimeji]|uniref:Glycosyl hydrolases family 28 n=1 Tax=Lyophyllum shimeji TaxID=47721 RepID=A0A9P3PN98_LYOSH|nr:putative glycosyl hydrolases family 28 [Lyophyllum shimeji]